MSPQRTPEQKAWIVWEAGYDYGAVATNAGLWDCSMDEAINILFEEGMDSFSTA